MRKESWLPRLRANIRSLLEEFADDEFQERVWFNGSEPEMSSYTEAICGIFDDCSIRDFLKNDRETGLTSAQKEKLTAFVDALDRFSNSIKSYPTREELNARPEWQIIQKLAANCLTDFPVEKLN